MSAVPAGPLSAFLLALGESPTLLERFRDVRQRAALLAEHGLTDHAAFAGELTLAAVSAHVQAEHPQANIRLMPWIRVSSLLDRIFGRSKDEPPPPPPPPTPPPPPPSDPEE